jgi:hypothetical protein
VNLPDLPWQHPVDVLLCKLDGVFPRCANCRHMHQDSCSVLANRTPSVKVPIKDPVRSDSWYPTCPGFQRKEDA